MIMTTEELPGGERLFIVGKKSKEVKSKRVTQSEPIVSAVPKKNYIEKFIYRLHKCDGGENGECESGEVGEKNSSFLFC